MRPSPLLIFIYRTVIGLFRAVIFAFKLLCNALIVGGTLVICGAICLTLYGMESDALAKLLGIILVLLGVVYMWAAVRKNRKERESL